METLSSRKFEGVDDEGKKISFKRELEGVNTKGEKVLEYIKACVDLTWLMNMPQPPLALCPLAKKGADFDSNFYREYLAHGTKVDYVVWPALQLHEAGPILAKGTAECFKKQ